MFVLLAILAADWIVEDPTILNEIRNERVMEFMTERRSMAILKMSGSLALNPHSSQRWTLDLKGRPTDRAVGVAEAAEEGLKWLHSREKC